MQKPFQAEGKADVKAGRQDSVWRVGGTRQPYDWRTLTGWRGGR